MNQSMRLQDKRILFVTGKGGVGKSTMAAAIATAQAQKGRKTLLVELGDRSFYQYFFGIPSVEYEPQKIEENLFLARWNAEGCLKEYVLHYLPIERLYRVFFENRVMKTFIKVAPAVSELAILGKITSGIRKIGPPLDYDLLVVDGYSTGHFLALLQSTKGLSEVIKSGPFGEQSKKIMQAITNPKWTQVLIVTLPESLPVSETQELDRALKDGFDLVSRILCNKLLDAPEHGAPEGSLEKDVLRFIEYLNNVRSRQQKYIADLKKTDPHVIEIPLVLSAKNTKELRQALVKRLDEWII